MSRATFVLCTLVTSVTASAHKLAGEPMQRRTPPRTTPFMAIDPLPVVGGASGSARTRGTPPAIRGGAPRPHRAPRALPAVRVAGRPTARVKIGRDVGQVVVSPDGAEAYAADRAGDRVVVVSLPGLAVDRSFAVRAEPWGLALAPDGKTLLVTAIAD